MLAPLGFVCLHLPRPVAQALLARMKKSCRSCGDPYPGGVRIHEAAAVGFDVGADAYERGRPGFPPKAIDRLDEELGLESGRRVVDLAAGTGKLTRLLLQCGAAVVAVEPVLGMRTKFREVLPDVPLLAGLAEQMPFRSTSIDAITVAQAFHWFDAERAIEELHRVLRPGGRLALVWNVRDEQASPLAARMSGFFDRYREGVPAFRDRAWERAFAATELFTPLETAVFEHEQRLSVDGFLDRATSVSFIAALPPDRQDVVRTELLEMVPAGASEVALPYRCEVSWCEKRQVARVASRP
jgi:SAM-dependent methyltransferase